MSFRSLSRCVWPKTNSDGVQLGEVRRDGAMRVAVTFEMGCVLERDADKNVVHKVVVKDSH